MRNYKKPPAINTSLLEGNKPEHKILHLLKFAVLAPSTHNTQPWQFRIKNNTCEVFIDKSRQLPAADPAKRDIYISLGAMLKNLEIAALAFNVLESIKLTRLTGDKIAVFRFKNLDIVNHVEREQEKELEFLCSRTNYRGPFGPTTVPHLVSDNKSVKALLFNDKQTINELADLTANGLRLAYALPEFRREIAAWIKPNTSRQKKGIPGYALRMPLLASHIIPRIMKRKDIGAKLAELNHKSFITASAVMVLATRGDKPRQWLEVGQQAQRFFLKTEKAGLACSIYVAAIETKQLRPKVSRLVNLSFGWQPQFLFCIGRPLLPKVYSPRESVKLKLLN